MGIENAETMLSELIFFMSKGIAIFDPLPLFSESYTIKKAKQKKKNPKKQNTISCPLLILYLAWYATNEINSTNCTTPMLTALKHSASELAVSILKNKINI